MKGDYERALTKYRWGVKMLKLPRRLGVSTIVAREVAYTLADHASRATFEDCGRLHAFPSLPRLAFMLRLNEKTVRRALEILEEYGYHVRRHRFNNSNVYELVVPEFAKDYATQMLDLLSNPRHRGETVDETDGKKVQTPGHICQKAGKNVQLPSDLPSDLNSISKRHPSDAIKVEKLRGLVEEKRLSEGVESLRAELSRSPDPLLNRRD